MIEVMAITNDSNLARHFEENGIDIIFIDLEKNGKYERQGHLDTLISNHSIEDISKLRKVLRKSKLLVRINPYNKETSEEEIEKVIKAGADIIMLPMFRSSDEVEKVLKIINNRVENCLLLETATAAVRLDEILEIKGINRIHVGLNDLSIDLKLDFMFECLVSDFIDYIIEKIKNKKIKYGIGGIAKLGMGDLKADYILCEHARLGSTQVILSRSFFKSIEQNNLKEEVKKIKKDYKLYLSYTEEEFKNNKNEMKKIIKEKFLTRGRK